MIWVQRREFITLLGGAAAAWPLKARAQQGERVRRIGVLIPASAYDAEFQTFVGAFLQALAQSGWTIGRNLRIDTRWATGDPAEIRRHAAELVALAPDVILSHGASTVGPLLQATRTIPVVFPAVVDPVGAGFFDSLARPGGIATGSCTFSLFARPSREFAPERTRTRRGQRVATTIAERVRGYCPFTAPRPGVDIARAAGERRKDRSGRQDDTIEG
jgi:putative ABC transport system substrate-binding protein